MRLDIFIDVFFRRDFVMTHMSFIRTVAIGAILLVLAGLFAQAQAQPVIQSTEIEGLI